MPQRRVGFEKQVRKCAAEVRVLLPELAERHSPLVVLAALTEHVGGGLFLCQESGACTPEEARAIIRRIEQLTFADGKCPRP
jgi:hypothetical protein